MKKSYLRWLLSDSSLPLLPRDFNNNRILKIKNKGSKGIHGERECERRKRQIANGQVKKENGLVV